MVEAKKDAKTPKTPPKTVPNYLKFAFGGLSGYVCKLCVILGARPSYRSMSMFITSDHM